MGPACSFVLLVTMGNDDSEHSHFRWNKASWQAFPYVQNIHSNFVMKHIAAYYLDPNFHLNAAPE